MSALRHSKAARLWVWPLALALALCSSLTPRAEEFIDEDPDLEFAKKSQNPLGDPISLPFEGNFDVGFSPEDALGCRPPAPEARVIIPALRKIA